MFYSVISSDLSHCQVQFIAVIIWIIMTITLHNAIPPTGGPGSGKGTQSLKIAERYGFEYVSVGELLRKKMIHNATSNRKWSLIAKIITNGELAPQVMHSPLANRG